MKYLIISIMSLAITVCSMAQTPLSFKYQAVARDASGNILANKNVSLRISILRGGVAGTIVYQESHTRATNNFGLVNLDIGQGSVSIGTMEGIQWGFFSHYLQIELDIEGGTNYQYLGSSQLLSVPYALHANTVKNDLVDDADPDPQNEIQTITLSGRQLTLSREGGTITLPDSTDNWGTQIVLTDTTLVGEGTADKPLRIAQQGATEDQILKWNGTSWVPGLDKQTDADADPVNEIQILSLTGNELTLSKEGGSVTLSENGDDWGSQVVITDTSIQGDGTSATPLKLAGQGATEGQTLKWNGTAWVPAQDDKDDADADDTNELQTLSKSGDTITLSDGGSITDEKEDADADPGNEIQQLSLNGNELSLSKEGGTVTLSDIGDDWGSQSAETDVSLTGDGTTGSPLGLARQGAGTGQVLKWNGSAWLPGSDLTGSSIWQKSGDNIYYSDGYVGIGTDDPNHMFHINTDRLFSGVILTNTASGQSASDGMMMGFQLASDYSNSWAYILNKENTPLWFGTNGTARMTIGPEGNVGIGTMSPSVALDIIGQVRIRAGSWGEGKVLTSDAIGVASWQTPSGGVWEQTGPNIHYTGGYVGIGIGASTPASILDINGQITIRGGSPGVGKVLTSNIDGKASWETPSGGGSTIWEQNGSKVYYAYGNVGIGTNDPVYDLQIHSLISSTSLQLTNSSTGTTVGDGLVLRSSGSDASLINKENGPLSFGVNNSSYLHLISGGYLGVGTMAPQSRLDVAGQIRITGGNPGTGKVLTSDASGLATWETPSGGGGDDGDWEIAGNDMYSHLSGNVGIGNSLPSHKLDVIGDRIKIANTGGDWLAMRADGSAGILDFTYSDGMLAIQGSADDNNIVLNPSRNSKVGIRMWAPSYTLDVNGDIRATGSVYYGGSAGSANGTAYIKPDFVFTEDYDVLSTEEVEKFVRKNNHLPWVTSAKREQKEHKDVINMTRMQFESLETMENLQLQIIELNNKLEKMSNLLSDQQKELKKLRSQKQR